MSDDKKKKIGYILMLLSLIILIVAAIIGGLDGMWSSFFWALLVGIAGSFFVMDTDSYKSQRENDYRKESVGNCPHCGSYKTYKLSTVGKVASVEMFGLASSTIGKQYGCHNCGHKW